MYNFLVTAQSGAWDASRYMYDRTRVFENTMPSILAKYKILDTMATEELMTFPSLFAYEQNRGDNACIGWIKYIEVTPRSVIIEHELDSTFPPIPVSGLSDFQFKLDIENGEWTRTHWALKNRKLFSILHQASLIKQPDVRRLNVFLCYASDDQAKVHALYQHLVEDGVNAWFDKKKLLPGQDWEMEIHAAIKSSDVILVCLSSRSVTKEGYLQKELRMALDIAEEKPDGIIFVIPARLEDCRVPEKLNRIHRADLFLDDGYGNLYKALEERANNLGIRIAKKNLP